MAGAQNKHQIRVFGASSESPHEEAAGRREVSANVLEVLMPETVTNFDNPTTYEQMMQQLP